MAKARKAETAGPGAGGPRYYCLVGMDGTGKSTQARRLARQCPGAPAAVVWGRWRPWRLAVFYLLPALVRLVRGARAVPGPATAAAEGRGHATTQDAGAPGGGVAGLLVRFWHTAVLCEYLLQVWLKALPARCLGRSVVFDRYIADVLIDLGHNLGYHPEGLKRLAAHPLWRLFPKPARAFLLDGDPEECVRRRAGSGNEAGLEFLRLRRRLYLELAPLLGLTIIAADGPVEKVTARLTEALKEAAEAPEDTR